jgi:hypothetical protein
LHCYEMDRLRENFKRIRPMMKRLDLDKNEPVNFELCVLKILDIVE